LDICFQTCCPVFACVVIHMKRQTCFVLRFGAIHSVGTI
jgi:hypothetical protein